MWEFIFQSHRPQLRPMQNRGSHVDLSVGFGGRCHRSPALLISYNFATASASCPFFALSESLGQTDMRMHNLLTHSYGKLPATTP